MDEAEHIETRLLRYIGRKGHDVTVRQAARALRVSQQNIVDCANSTHTLEIDGVAIACGNAIGDIDNPGDWLVGLAND